jgi:hypothetical protein
MAKMASHQRRISSKIFMKNITFFYSLLLCTIIFPGCVTAPFTGHQTKIDFKGYTNREAYAGYALLSNLVNKEKNVDKILILKKANGEVENFIKETAQTFLVFHEELNRTSSLKDKILDLKAVFPETELRARALIEKNTTATLLTSNGEDFEFQILLTQQKALEYAESLILTLQEQDLNTTRIAMLKKYEKKLHFLKIKAMQLLQK